VVAIIVMMTTTVTVVYEVDLFVQWTALDVGPSQHYDWAVCPSDGSGDIWHNVTVVTIIVVKATTSIVTARLVTGWTELGAGWAILAMWGVPLGLKKNMTAIADPSDLGPASSQKKRALETDGGGVRKQQYAC
jgi:hypothetical protein